MELGKVYLESIIKRMSDYKKMAEKAIDQLEPELLFLEANEDSNSIAIIIQHLCGNMISRWTNFLTQDGEKPWRERDAEFEVSITSKEELMKKWEEGWSCLFNALNKLTPVNLMDIVTIRGEQHSAMDAINRQLAHYPYHVGQIVFAAKLLKNGGFISMSIPKGKSKEFNNNMIKK